MSEIRKIQSLSSSRETMEGAGVRLKRAFGNQQMPRFDPFLLLDDFRSDTPDDYLNGFPWHPHRGIETITYVLRGDVEHGDSMGNKGNIGSGDVQWMTAGSGIIHQEMPKGDSAGSMWGFQLWANLPASRKMMEPRYRDVKSDTIPEIELDGGVKVKVISGTVGDTRGPVRDIVIDPEYLDISLPANTEFRHPVKRGYTVFAYVIDGGGLFPLETGDGGGISESGEIIGNTSLALFGDGDEIAVSTADSSMRFLLISGKPLNEPIAWYGPIVMNTNEELETAFDEYRNGTFIKHR